MLRPGWNRLQHTVFTPPPGLAPAVLTAVSYERTCGDLEGVNLARHEHWVLDCAWSPGLRVRIGAGDWQERPPGRLHCYAPGTPYAEDWRGLRRRRLAGQYLIVRDPVGVLTPLTGALGHACIDDADGRLRALLQEPFAIAGTPGFWTCQALWCALVGHLLAATPDGPGRWRCGGVPSQPSLVQRVEDLLRLRLDDAVGIADLARELDVSPSSLSHRFRAEAGETVMGRLRRLRVERALALLPQGLRLDDIAAACGFCDRFHLAKAVRRLTGRPPSVWRGGAPPG
jgi:AraC-like DNA-binding protein